MQMFEKDSKLRDFWQTEFEESLRRIGASDISKVIGHPGRIAPLFHGEAPSAAVESASLGPELAEAVKGRLFAEVPPAYLCALQMIGHDLFEAVALPDPGDGRPGVRKTIGIANRKTGVLSLGPVYGECALSGDIAMALERCKRSPWDRARLWVEESGPNRAGDLLRLHRVILGNGAMFSECFFEQLPPHLKLGYFEHGELMLHRALVSDVRSDQSLLLSQFHYSVSAVHNRMVSELERAFGHIDDRDVAYQNARACTLQAFAGLTLTDVLPRFCDPDVLSIVMAQTAPLHRRVAETLGGKPFLPAEAPTLLEGLFGFVPAYAIRPKPSANQDLPALAPAHHSSTDPYAGLPRALFVSRRVPTRLSPKHVVEWPRFLALDNIPACKATPIQAAGRIRFALDLGMRMKLPSGQACARAARAAYGLDITALGAGEVHEWLGIQPPTTASASASQLLPYIVAEAGLLGKAGRLGPLGTLILAETIVGAADMMRSQIGVTYAQPAIGSWTLEKFLMKSVESG